MRRSGPQTWPEGGGEMAARIRAHDWCATSLGAVEGWAQPLRTAAEMMLASPMLTTLAVGPERVFLYNDVASRYHGNRHPGVLGRPLAQAFAHEFAAVERFYERVFAGESLHVAAQRLDPGESGRPEVFDAYLSPVRDASGEVIAAFMTGFAMGERLRLEAALRKSEERFRSYVMASSDVVYRMSADWSQMRELNGRGFLVDTAEPRAAWVDQYIPHEERPAVRAAIHRAITTRSPFELEHRVVRADGTLGWTLSRAVPILDGE